MNDGDYLIALQQTGGNEGIRTLDEAQHPILP